MDLREQLQATLGGAYTLDRELGGGGMSRVFLAEEHALGRKVVVKVLSPELTADVSTERFVREMRMAARLQQANVVPLLTSGETAGLPYYIMPFVEGQSLRQRIKDASPLPISEAVNILRDVARALAFAHERHVVHRDIKPENVLLSGDSAVVTDFGIAKALVASRTDAGERNTLTSVGAALGTPAYMAPEQALGDANTDQRADVYSFGCVAYELLSGAPPFPGKRPQQLLIAHVHETPPRVDSLRSDTPAPLASLIARCLSKDPSARPYNAREILDLLDGAVTGPRLIAARPSWRRSRLIGAAVVVASVGVAITATWSARGGSRALENAGLRNLAVMPFTNVGETPPSSTSRTESRST